MIISPNGFDFIPLRDVYSYDKKLILDVMGEVRRPGKMEYIESAGGRKYDIVLADSDGTEIECTLWEGHAELVKQAIDNKAKDDIKPTFLTLQFVMISSYKDVRRISTMKNATKLFLNPEFQEVRDFIKRRSNGESSSCRTMTNDSDHDEWLDTTSILPYAGVYTTKAKIIDVDADEPWYYELCGNVACFKRVDLGKVVGDTCNKCSAPIGSILTRFRIRILVADHSGQTYFTLVESSAPYFINKSATQLKKETDKSDDPNELPDSFNKLLERECLFKVEVSDRFHIQSKKDGYTVKKVTEHVDLLAQFSSISCTDEIVTPLIFEGEVVSTDKARTEGSYSETIEECSSTSITPLKRGFDSILEDIWFWIRILVADHSRQTYFTLVESSAPYSVNKSATKLKKETDEEQVQNFTLAEISKLLVDNYSSLRNFDYMPIPDESIIADVRNMLILEKTSYNLDEMCAEHSKLYPLLTGDQRTVYDKIMYAVDKGVGGVFFLYGYSGTGKTFTWRTLCSALRGKGDIVLPVASSGIASLLIPKGRTAHSRFGIPLLVDEKSYCNKIKLGTEMTELLKKTKLIIWDEAPMTHRYCFEALDRSLKDVMRSPDGEPSPKPFGG
ncbi:hypothetical protein OROMI_028071 [Orobanche minor]